MENKFRKLVETFDYYTKQLQNVYQDDEYAVYLLTKCNNNLRNLELHVDDYDENKKKKFEKRLERYVNYFSLLDNEQMFNYMTEMPYQLEKFDRE